MRLSGKEAWAAVLLPHRVEFPANVFGNVKLGMEIVPAGEVGAGLIIEINKEAGDEKQSKDGPVPGNMLTEQPKLPDREAMLCFGDILGHKLV